MSGLGKVQDSGATFLSIAGGFIWDRKADKSHEDYAEQEYEKADKTTGIRTGARYGDLTGQVTKVAFRTHAEYGESINVNFLAGGETYIISISTNNRYSQDMMKALLVMDLEKPIFVKPYDFVGQDKKRAQGISFKQDGEKLALKVEVPSDFTKDEDWFKKADKKQIKRFFEDLNEWYVAEVEEKVVPKIKTVVPEEKSEETPEKTAPKKVETKKEEVKKEEVKKEEVKEVKEESKQEEEKPTVGVSILAMKKVLRPYIAENYPGQELPELSPVDMLKWYNLAIAEEELPFEDVGKSEESEENSGELSQEDLDSQLNALMED